MKICYQSHGAGMGRVVECLPGSPRTLVPSLLPRKEKEGLEERWRGLQNKRSKLGDAGSSVWSQHFCKLLCDWVSVTMLAPH